MQTATGFGLFSSGNARNLRAFLVQHRVLGVAIATSVRCAEMREKARGRQGRQVMVGNTGVDNTGVDPQRQYPHRRPRPAAFAF